MIALSSRQHAPRVLKAAENDRGPRKCQDIKRPKHQVLVLNDSELRVAEVEANAAN
jgi:hypothetical protein